MTEREGTIRELIAQALVELAGKAYTLGRRPGRPQRPSSKTTELLAAAIRGSDREVGAIVSGALSCAVVLALDELVDRQIVCRAAIPKLAAELGDAIPKRVLRHITVTAKAIHPGTEDIQ